MTPRWNNSSRTPGHVGHARRAGRQRWRDGETSPSGAALLGPFQVFAGPGIYPDDVVRLDEGRDLDLQAGLEGRFLVLIRDGRALEGRRRIGHLEIDDLGDLDAHRLA